MNKTISIIRIAILATVCCLAILFLFGEEQDENVLAFFFHAIVDKAIAFALFFWFARLYKRWSKVDPWIEAYDKMVEEVMDKPNPTKN